MIRKCDINRIDKIEDRLRVHSSEWVTVDRIFVAERFDGGSRYIYKVMCEDGDYTEFLVNAPEDITFLLGIINGLSADLAQHKAVLAMANEFIKQFKTTVSPTAPATPADAPQNGVERSGMEE